MKVTTVIPVIALSAGIADASMIMVRSTAAPINAGAVALIEKVEGFVNHFYFINGDKTIGIGHDCTQKKDCDNIHAPISRAQGEALLQNDLKGFEACTCALPNAAKLNANQYGALVSFAFNSGCGGVSKFFKAKMAASDFNGICAALPTTNTLKGQLSNRRKQEGAFCSQATTQPSGCGGATSAPPASKPPASKPPASKPPASKPPASKPPASKPPASKPPASKPPSSGGKGSGGKGGAKSSAKASASNTTPAPASNTTPAPASNTDPAPASNTTPAPASNTDPAPASNTDPAPASNTDPAPASNTDPAPASATDGPDAAATTAADDGSGAAATTAADDGSGAAQTDDGSGPAATPAGDSGDSGDEFA